MFPVVSGIVLVKTIERYLVIFYFFPLYFWSNISSKYIVSFIRYQEGI